VDRVKAPAETEATHGGCPEIAAGRVLGQRLVVWNV
jgi:hypothetical protein